MIRGTTGLVTDIFTVEPGVGDKSRSIVRLGGVGGAGGGGGGGGGGRVRG